MFNGSMVALVTPMLDDKVDVGKLKELVEFHIAEGTSAIVAAGTTGESGTLSYQEKVLVIRTIIAQVRERIPVIAGTAANSTQHCIELTKLAMSEGAHAALIMTPAYIRPTQQGLYQHYATIAREVAIPIILYNVPSRTACDLLPETAIQLAKISNIIGIKEATADITRLQKLIQGSQGTFDVYSGDDLSAAEWMLAGAKGVISVTANVVPRLMAKMCAAALDGDRDVCSEINSELLDLHELLFVESNPIPVKWAVYKIGLMNDEIRMPLTRLSVENQARLESALDKLRLLS